MNLRLTGPAGKPTETRLIKYDATHSNRRRDGGLSI